MTQSTPKVFYMLHSMHQALFRSADRALQDTLDITSVQSAVLMHLSKGPARISEIADVLGQKISSVSGLLDRMETRGLLNRAVSKTDGRAVSIELSPEGIELATKAKAFVKHTNAQLLSMIEQHIDPNAFSAACEAIRADAEKIIAGEAKESLASAATQNQNFDEKVENQ